VIGAILCMVLFASCAALGLYAGRLVVTGVPELPDSPPSGSPKAAYVLAAAAMLGALAGIRGTPALSLGILALVCTVLAAVWYADIVRGIIPDVFTLVPLGAIVVAAALTSRWEVLLSAAIPAAPFAILAWRTHGRGIGWGDVKLAAFGGALIGMQNAVLFFAIASFLAIVVGRFRNGAPRPIAFGPYMVLAIAVPLALHASG
jgi:prepilin signal peptidase PulO-like enzyme (type II secretory pathway)